MPHATCRDDVIVNYFQILRQRPKQLALLLVLRKRKQRQDSPQHGKHNTTQAWQTHTHALTCTHTHSHTRCAGLSDCTLLLSVSNIFIHLFALFSHSARIYRSPPHRSSPLFCWLLPHQSKPPETAAAAAAGARAHSNPENRRKWAKKENRKTKLENSRKTHSLKSGR